jgi:hypothetical protein
LKNLRLKLPKKANLKIRLKTQQCNQISYSRTGAAN